MVESALRVSEGSGSVDVCVESNIISGSVQTPLIINVTVSDAKAGEVYTLFFLFVKVYDNYNSVPRVLTNTRWNLLCFILFQ